MTVNVEPESLSSSQVLDVFAQLGSLKGIAVEITAHCPDGRRSRCGCICVRELPRSPRVRDLLGGPFLGSAEGIRGVTPPVSELRGATG